MGYFVCYNKTMRKFKQSSKSNSKKTNYTIQRNNVILENTKTFKFRGSDFTNKIKIISVPKEPFIKQTFEE